MAFIGSRNTRDEGRRKARRILVACLLAAVVLMLVFLLFTRIDEGLREQGQLSVRNAILNASKQCYAIEGAYPTSLKHLEDNYGVVINHDDYIVTYEVFAENVMPSVVVLAK